MSKVIIIGAGGVGSVVAHKCAQVSEVFTDIVLPLPGLGIVIGAGKTDRVMGAITKGFVRRLPTTTQGDNVFSGKDIGTVGIFQRWRIFKNIGSVFFRFNNTTHSISLYRSVVLPSIVMDFAYRVALKTPVKQRK